MNTPRPGTMTAAELAELVRTMRRFQTAYFRTRARQALEAAVDEATARHPGRDRRRGRPGTTPPAFTIQGRPPMTTLPTATATPAPPPAAAIARELVRLEAAQFEAKARGDWPTVRGLRMARAAVLRLAAVDLEPQEARP